MPVDKNDLIDKQITHESKIVLIGDMSVGKTSLINQYINKQFNKFTESTIGASFFSKNLKINKKETDNKYIKLNIWDTAGQERYHSLIPMYYRGSNCVIIIYDITQPLTFEQIKSKWMYDIEHHMSLNTLVVIVGNKIDLEEKRKVKKEDVQKFCDENNFTFFEVSAKKNTNIELVFENVVKLLFENNLAIPIVETKNYDNYVKKRNCCNI